MSAYTRMQARIAELEAALKDEREENARLRLIEGHAVRIEREACARIAETYSAEIDCAYIAKAIRARGSK